MGKVRLAFLGPPSIERDGAAVHLDTRKAIALMAYLCVIGKPVGRDTLVTLLWSRYGRAEGHASLRRTLSTLRSALGHEYIDADRETACLAERAGIWIDLSRFRELLTLLASHPHGATSICRRCLPVLSEAARLYRGQFLLGFTLKDSVDFDDWQLFTTEKYRLEAVQVLDRLAVCSAAAGDLRSAVGYAHERLELDRLDESAHVQLMRLFAWEGNRAAAKHQFDECRRLMEKELQSPPQPATVRLAEAIAHGQVPDLPVFADEPVEEAEQPRRSKRNQGPVSKAAAQTIAPASVVVPGGGERSTIRRIAVLPFTNISPDPNDEYFADGLTEELISAVSKIGGLRTISRSSAMRFKSSEKTLAEIAEELHVGAVVEGSVRKAGNHVRISLQLVDVRSDEHLWSQDYDRQLEDIFAIQSDIAGKVALALQVHVQAREKAGIDRRATGNIESYDEYLKGIYYSRRKTRADLELACAHLQRALEIDPSFAAAHSALAFAARFLHSFALDRAPAILETARQHAEEALRLDPHSADALLMRALIQRDRGELGDAIATLRNVVEASPSHAQANFYLGNAYRDTGEIGQALDYHARAFQLDPKDFFFAHIVVSDSLAAGAKKDLAPLVERLESLNPGHFLTLLMQGEVAAAAGDEESAFRYIERGISADSDHVDSHVVQALYSLYFGRSENAYTSIRHVIDHSDLRPFSVRHGLFILFSLRRFDEVLSLAEAAFPGDATTIFHGTDLKALGFLYRGIIFRARGAEKDALVCLGAAEAASAAALERFPQSPSLLSFHAHVLSLCGDHERAAREIELAVRERSEYNACWYDRARICAIQGDRGGLIESLHKAVEHAAGEQGALRDEITFDAFRHDPEFLALTDPRRPRIVPPRGGEVNG
jgi:adenylate cyclase